MKSLLDYFMAGEKAIFQMCRELGCQPEKEKCAKCFLGTLYDNLKFRYEMGWYNAVKEYAFMLFEDKERLKEIVRRRRRLDSSRVGSQEQRKTGS